MAAKFVRDHLFSNLLGHEHFDGNLIKAVEDAFTVRRAGCCWRRRLKGAG